MTNREIIETEKRLRGITEDIHTFKAWQQAGYHVKKGEKAIASFRIWKQIYERNKETEETYSRMILAKASFFARSQVERV